MKRGVTAPRFLGAVLAAVALFSSFSAAASLPLHKAAGVSSAPAGFHQKTIIPPAPVAPPRGRGPGTVGGKPAAAGINGSGFKKYGAGR